MRQPLPLLALLAACSDPVAPPVPEVLDVLHGPTAISVPGQRYDTISVRLTGSRGESIVGWPVTWSGDGEVVPLDSVTDDVGIARAQWTLPRYGSLFGFYHSGPSGDFELRVEAIGFGHSALPTEARAFTLDRIDATTDWGYGCGLRGDGLWCWGIGHGLGDGSGRPVRVPLPTQALPLDFKTGSAILCLLDEQRLPWCRSLEDADVWQRIDGAPALHDLVVLESYSYRGSLCGRAQADGRIWCWPQDQNSNTPAAPIADRPFAQVAGGREFGCAIDLEGAAWCWGANGSGQLGAGDTEAHSSPVAVTGGHRFERVSAGGDLVCASDLLHHLWCWGRIDRNTVSPTPVPIDHPWFRGPDILVGNYMDLYVLRDGEVRVWLRGAEWPSLSVVYADYDVAEFAGRGAWCIRTVTRETYCGMTIFRRVTDVFFPIDLLPVPDPASQVSP